MESDTSDSKNHIPAAKNIVSKVSDKSSRSPAGYGADSDFEMDSKPPEKGGDTLCGRLGRKHKMKRHGPMKTACVYQGCDAIC